MIKLDGYIVSAVPYFSPSHGYYNVNPTLLREFYCPENGFELLFLKCNSSQSFSVSLSGKGETIFSLQDLNGKRVINIVPARPINTIYYIAKKVNSNIPDFTLQAKYR